jgi:hypothetical protein
MMATEPMADITLDFIGAQLQRVLDGQRATDRRLGEITDRLGRIERLTADMMRDIANLHGDFAAQSVRMDNISMRLGRVEQRLELISPLPPAAQ